MTRFYECRARGISEKKRAEPPLTQVTGVIFSVTRTLTKKGNA